MKGLEALLEAAQYLEQQEKLKLSPQSVAATSPSSGCNERYLLQHATTFEHVVANGGSSGGGNIINNNNISNGKNANARHISQVSSSAPAAAATFHHANGLNIITGNNGTSNSQLATAAAVAAAATTNHHNDYEFSNGNKSVDVCNTEEPCSSNVVVTSPNTSPHNSINANSSSKFVLLQTAEKILQQQQQQQQTTATFAQNGKTKPNDNIFAYIDSNNVACAAASKQMLLNGGVRIASPAATIGGSSALIAAKVIAIAPPPHLQQQQQQSSMLSTSFPLYSPPNNNNNNNNTNSNSNNMNSMNGGTLQRHKKYNPLTPPPMPSRKFVETTNTRNRSFSLSSHKFSAPHQQQQQLSLQQQQHHNMASASEDSHMSYVSAGGSSSASPPRHHLNGGAGSHYMQMMSGSQATQPTPLIGGSGRRRTISSNSNGAGTREVHNKLEKNRRAHLKECYEQLKKQLQLRDEKKTSNLAILGEAHAYVVTLKRMDEDLEAQVEQLAKEKINAQKKIVSLKRELGPKFEQLFAGIMPDIELGSIPVERETLNDSGSLSSGRGSLLYSSSSSLSSGGSSNNTVSSPVGAGLQTAMPTALSPVISQKMNTNSTASPSCVIVNTTTTAAATTTAAPNMLLQQMKCSVAAANNINNTLGLHVSPAGSPTLCVSASSSPTSLTTTTINGLQQIVTMPLSLTAKNISATSLTRGSPTPSTPSPSPSSSSGVSSSSSIISSSPPMNGAVINGVGGTVGRQQVMLNIPSGMKFHAAGGMGNGTTTTTIGTLSNGTAVNIIAAAPVGAIGGGVGVNSNNNATWTATTTTTTSASSTPAAVATMSLNQRRTTAAAATSPSASSSSSMRTRKTHSPTLPDNEQRTKVSKVLNSSCSNNSYSNFTLSTSQLPLALSATTAAAAGSSFVLSSGTTTNTSCVSSNNSATFGSQSSLKFVLSSCSSNGDLHSLPGGAELNILPTEQTAAAASTATAAAFLHANGKLTLLPTGVGYSAGSATTQFKGTELQSLSQQQHQQQLSPAANTFTLSNGNLLQLTTAGSFAAFHTNGGGSNGYALLPAAAANFGAMLPLNVSTTTTNVANYQQQQPKNFPTFTPTITKTSTQQTTNILPPITVAAAAAAATFAVAQTTAAATLTPTTSLTTTTAAAATTTLNAVATETTNNGNAL